LLLRLPQILPLHLSQSDSLSGRPDCYTMSNSNVNNNASEGYDHLYKIVLVGDATVGKTHLADRYTRGTLPKAPTATIGVMFTAKIVNLAVGGKVKVQIWDTAGQERFRSITSAHYRRAVGALLVYDVTKQSTFQNCQKWMEEVRQSAEPDCVIMLVGNKVDLAEKGESERQVFYDTAAEFARQNNLFFTEASAVTGANVKHAFEHLLQEIYNQMSKGRGRDAGANNDIAGIQIGSRPSNEAKPCC